MANNNPISLKTDGPFIDFNIPPQHLQDDIRMSIQIELLDDGWVYDSDHIVSIQGNLNDLYNDDAPPDKLLIGTGGDVIGKKFRSYSHIMRIRDGATTNNPSRVKFIIRFFANDTLLDEFDETSDNSNPENFIANIKFK
jgi:hypothetical protein